MATVTDSTDLKEKTISELSRMCTDDWTKLPQRGTSAFYNHPAGHYLNAMFSLDSIDDKYGAETGRNIVPYFLSNATRWTGDVARAVKKELNRRLKG